MPIELIGVHAAMVESLTAKAKAWECERGEEFKYDGVMSYPKIYSLFCIRNWLHTYWNIYCLLCPYCHQVSLHSMLEKYRILQQDKEQERRRQRVIFFHSWNFENFMFNYPIFMSIKWLATFLMSLWTTFWF